VNENTCQPLESEKSVSESIRTTEQAHPEVDACHIVLRFTLLDSNRLPRNPTEDEFRVLRDLFPMQTGVGVVGPFLVIYVQVLPPKPWPVSVAGLPLLHSKEYVQPSVGGRNGWGC
jgi:hypothetical protein